MFQAQAVVSELVFSEVGGCGGDGCFLIFLFSSCLVGSTRDVVNAC